MLTLYGGAISSRTILSDLTEWSFTLGQNNPLPPYDVMLIL